MKKGRAKYDWEKIKQEFFNSDILEVNAFIKHRLGIGKAQDGNVRQHIVGWTEEKKIWKRKRFEEAQKEADKALIEKMKISLEDLLINKRLLFSLDAKYLEILGRLTDSKRQPTKEERMFFGAYQDKVRDIYKRIQIELGLPVNIEELQGRKEKPLVFVDLIRQAEEAKKDANRNRGDKDKGGD